MSRPYPAAYVNGIRAAAPYAASIAHSLKLAIEQRKGADTEAARRDIWRWRRQLERVQRLQRDIAAVEYGDAYSGL